MQSLFSIYFEMKRCKRRVLEGEWLKYGRIRMQTKGGNTHIGQTLKEWMKTRVR